MDIFEKIALFCKKHALIPEKASLVLGLSGGPDSVFLLHFLTSLVRSGSITLTAAHLDHQWREESSRDLLFCKQLAQTLGVPFIGQTLSEIQVKKRYNGSRESFARDARRQFFSTLKHDLKADFIALAHHADDQQETFFIRLIRGATITGLSAMLPKDDIYIRPLLEISKDDLVSYLHHHAIPYITDSTNESEEFLRNRIRKNVIPALRTCDARFDYHFQKALYSLQELDNFMENTAKTFFETMIVTEKDSKISLCQKKFLQCHTLLQYRVLIYWLCKEKVPFTPSQSLFNEIFRFLQQSQKKEHCVGKNWKIVKENAAIRIVIF